MEKKKEFSVFCFEHFPVIKMDEKKYRNHGKNDEDAR